MSTNESNNIARVVAEMSAATTSRSDRDWKKAQKAAQQERIDEQVEAARLVAKETLDERDRRWREYNDFEPRQNEQFPVPRVCDGGLRLRPRRVRLRHGRSPRRTSRHPASAGRRLTPAVMVLQLRKPRRRLTGRLRQTAAHHTATTTRSESCWRSGTKNKPAMALRLRVRATTNCPVAR